MRRLACYCLRVSQAVRINDANINVSSRSQVCQGISSCNDI